MIDLKGHLVDVLTVGGIAAGVGIIAVNTEGTVTIIKLVGLYCDRTVGKFCVGGAVFSDIEKDNAVLDAFFAKKHVNPLDFEYKTVYVNGDNNLQNIKTEDENWKVILIESEMKKRMFEV